MSVPADAVDDNTFSVTQLNTTIRNALRAAIPTSVWVRGEVQGLRKSRPGHLYFQLVEKDARRDRVQSAMDVALFRNHLMTVNAELRKVPGVELANDVEVRIRASVDVYPATGRLQLIMTGIDPVFTAGKLAADRDRVLRLLQAEGLLAANGTRQLAPVPLRVGLITSAGARRTTTSCTSWRRAATRGTSACATSASRARTRRGGWCGGCAGWRGSRTSSTRS